MEAKHKNKNTKDIKFDHILNFLNKRAAVTF